MDASVANLLKHVAESKLPAGVAIR
jgi:hypothetical protein